MNILLGILKYPPDYAGDGLRFHRMFKRLKQAAQLDKVHVLTSWDQRQETGPLPEIRDEIHIHRAVENTSKEKYEGRNRLLKRLIVPFNLIRITARYFSLAPSVDVVLTSGSGWLPSWVAWLALLTQKPLLKEIVLLQCDDPLTLTRRSPLIRWFFILPFRFARLIITISPPLEKACLDFGIPPEKLWCRLNPVDLCCDPLKQAPAVPSGPQPSTVPTVLWVGTIKPRKNVRFLLQAARFMPPPVRLIFAGPHEDAAYFTELLNLAQTLPPGIEVIFTGALKDPGKLRSLYSEADLFWFASHKEGMGNVVAEALMCGTPVVTLPVLGIMEHVLPTAEDGAIVTEDDPEEFAAVASYWLKKHPDREAIARRAATRFSAAQVDATYVAWFQKVTAENRGTIAGKIQPITPKAAL